MRRTYMSPEFEKREVYGTYGSHELSTFMSGKMIKVDDSIFINNEDIIWYQRDSNEQLDLAMESTLEAYIYSPSNDKYENSKLTMESRDTKNDVRRRNTTWIFEIKIEDIVRNYIFSLLKKYRTFEGLKNSYSRYNDIDIDIYNYIDFNIIDRYAFSMINLYIQYTPISSNNAIKYKNTWQSELDKVFLVKDYQISLNDDKTIATIIFSQPNSDLYVFNYYYEIIYDRL